MKAKNYTRFVLLLITLSLVSCGRKTDRQEQLFIQKLDQMLTWPDNGTYSDELMNSVFDTIKSNPQSIDFEFKDEISNIHITTSDDGNMRAYNLERYGFEGNPSLGFECKTLIQYKSGESVFYKEVENFIGYITRIHHIESGKYYILEDWQGCICQGQSEMTTLYLYKIENNKLRQVKDAFVFRDHVSNSLEFSWDDYGGRIEFDYDKEDSFVSYSTSCKELFVIKDMPLNGQPLKYRQYAWNGRNFELKKYDEPAEYYNEKFFIQIEQETENTWTYKCWNGGEKKGKPDLIIKSGTKQYWVCIDESISSDEWDTDNENSSLWETYTFYNNGYRYEYSHGWRQDRSVYELCVYDPNDNEIYSGELRPVLQH